MLFTFRTNRQFFDIVLTNLEVTSLNINETIGLKGWEAMYWSLAATGSKLKIKLQSRNDEKQSVELFLRGTEPLKMPVE